MTDTYTMELAHAMPGRIRLRWRGEGPPPGDLISEWESLQHVIAVQCRVPTHSVLVSGDSRLTVDALRDAASAVGADIVDPPEPKPLFDHRPKPPVDAKDALWRDVEAGLLVVVMFSWIRDLVVNRVFRLSTVLLIIITAMDLYRHWLRRQSNGQGEDAAAALEVLEA